MMTRREALLRVTALVGGTVFGAHRFLGGMAFAAESRTPLPLSAHDLAVLGEVAETILPATKSSGGAKAAKVPEFMQEMAADYYEDRERDLLLGAAKFFDEASGANYAGRDFLALTGAEREHLLLGMDRTTPQPETYRMVKQLSLWGYWTSEVAAKQALVYLPVPGVYRGCVDVAPDAKALF